MFEVQEMLLTAIGCYAVVALVYWVLRYKNTESEEAKEEARKDFIKTYLECLRWLPDLLRDVPGFPNKPSKLKDK